MTDKLSIIIPTYNRPQPFMLTLSFLQKEPVRFPVIVVDGSNAEGAAARNEDICKKAGDNITYMHLPSPKAPPGVPSHADYKKLLDNYIKRVVTALDRVGTPYVAMLADDDLLVSPAALKAADFLDANPDYVVAQGKSLGFRYSPTGIEVGQVIYEGPSIDGDEVGTRLMQLYTRYEAPSYGVYRTQVLRGLMPESGNADIGLFQEGYMAAATVISGKVKRLDDVYYLRNMSIPPNARPLEGWGEWYAKNFDEFFEHYRKHRTRLLMLAGSKPGLSISLDTLRCALDMSFIVYMGREFNMDAWLNEYLVTAISTEGERNRLRSVFEKKKAEDYTRQMQIPVSMLSPLVRLLIRKSLLETKAAVVFWHRRTKERLIRFVLGEAGVVLQQRIHARRAERRQQRQSAVAQAGTKTASRVDLAQLRRKVSV